MNIQKVMHPGFRIVCFIILALISFLSWFMFSRYFYVPVLIVDEAFYIEVAKKFLSGSLGYRDNKPPGIFLIYALIIKLTGKTDLSIMHNAAAYAHIISGWLIFFLIKKAQSKLPALIAASAYLILPSLSNSPSNFYAANTEIFMMVPWLTAWLALAFSQVRPGLLVIAGFSAGCAMLIKQQGAFLIPAFCFILLVDRSFYLQYSFRKVIKKYFVIATGFLCAVLPVMVVFSLKDSFMSVFYNWFLVNKNIAAVSGSISWAPSRIRFRAEYLELIYIFAFLGFLIHLTFLFRQKPQGSLKINSSLLWIVMAIISYAGLHIGGNYSGHYFIMLFPALALFFGSFCSYIFEQINRINGKYRRQIYRLLWVTVITWCFVYPLIIYTGFPPGSKTLVTYIDRKPFGDMIKTTALYLRLNTKKDDTLFVWGFCPELYYLSGRRPASRHIHCNFLVGDICPYPYGPRPKNIIERHWDELFADLTNSMPEYIIDISPSNYLYFGSNSISLYPDFQSFLNTNYKIAKTIHSFIIYEKK